MSSILSLGGLGFTLPSSLPSFLAGSSIGFDLPSKYIPQIGINLDGSAYFAHGHRHEGHHGYRRYLFVENTGPGRPGKAPARSGKRGLLRQTVCQGAGRMEGAGKQTVSVPGQLYGGGRVLLRPSGALPQGQRQEGFHPVGRPCWVQPPPLVWR